MMNGYSCNSFRLYSLAVSRPRNVGCFGHVFLGHSYNDPHKFKFIIFLCSFCIHNMDALATLQEQLEGLPGFDYVIDYYNDKAGSKWQTKNPYFVEINGKRKKRKLPDSFSKESKKTWKRIQKKAWFHDNNFFGCFPVNLGIGISPILAIIPVIGPFLMYAIHGRLINIANEAFPIPLKLNSKLQANILLDLVLSLIPLFGIFLTWMKACSTRNAALIHSFIVEVELKKIERLRDKDNGVRSVDLNYSGVRPPNQPTQARAYAYDQ